jgi:multidrug efflux pump subunit AcrA (membrane-fusion protein)
LLKSRADADFARDRLQKTRELAAAQEAHYQTIVNRLTNITSGSVALKELTAAQADLLRTQLQDQKDIYAEESALRVARQQLASDERELAQQGLEPEVLSRARDGMVLISASVPESKIALVQENQSCQARFYGFPEKLYSGHVEHLGSVLNSQRRTLRVLFDLTDDDEVLRPGMFADVYLGTDERTVILIPNDALVHLGRFQYVFRELQSGRFEVVRVEAAEPLGGFREIRTGLRPGDRIVTQGAILLKPMAAQIVGRPST